MCEGNWQGAEVDGEATLALIHEEVAHGWVKICPGTLQDAKQKWGDKRTAVGKINVVRVPGKKDWMVMDSTVPGLTDRVRQAENHKTQIRNRSTTQCRTTPLEKNGLVSLQMWLELTNAADSGKTSTDLCSLPSGKSSTTTVSATSGENGPPTGGAGWLRHFTVLPIDFYGIHIRAGYTSTTGCGDSGEKMPLHRPRSSCSSFWSWDVPSASTNWTSETRSSG